MTEPFTPIGPPSAEPSEPSSVPDSDISDILPEYSTESDMSTEPDTTDNLPESDNQDEQEISEILENLTADAHDPTELSLTGRQNEPHAWPDGPSAPTGDPQGPDQPTDPTTAETGPDDEVQCQRCGGPPDHCERCCFRDLPDHAPDGPCPLTPAPLITGEGTAEPLRPADFLRTDPRNRTLSAKAKEELRIQAGFGPLPSEAFRPGDITELGEVPASSYSYSDAESVPASHYGERPSPVWCQWPDGCANRVAEYRGYGARPIYCGEQGHTSRRAYELRSRAKGQRARSTLHLDVKAQDKRITEAEARITELENALEAVMDALDSHKHEAEDTSE